MKKIILFAGILFSLYATAQDTKEESGIPFAATTADTATQYHLSYILKLINVNSDYKKTPLFFHHIGVIENVFSGPEMTIKPIELEREFSQDELIKLLNTKVQEQTQAGKSHLRLILASIKNMITWKSESLSKNNENIFFYPMTEGGKNTIRCLMIDCNKGYWSLLSRSITEITSLPTGTKMFFIL